MGRGGDVWGKWEVSLCRIIVFDLIVCDSAFFLVVPNRWWKTAQVEDARSVSLSPRITRKEMLDKSFEENNQLLKMMKSPHVETILQVRKRSNPVFQNNYFLNLV